MMQKPGDRRLSDRDLFLRQSVFEFGQSDVRLLRYQLPHQILVRRQREILVAAEFGRVDAARPPVKLEEADDGTDADPALLRSFGDGGAALDRPDHSPAQIRRIWLRHSCWPPPSRQLESYSRRYGNPRFSLFGKRSNGKIVGGPMWSPTEGARATAAAAVRMLGGEKASGIKVRPIEFSVPKYDWRQLRRWNISESRLPVGSEVLFREPTAWERYSWQLALITAVILAQAGLISALLNAHRRRRLAEVQSRQRMAELAHVNRFSTAGVLTASIAHEINQPLGAILTNAETADEILNSPSPDIAELKDIVKDILQDDRRAGEVIRRMRSLLKKAPFELKNIDLNDLVRETVEFLSALAIARRVELLSLITPDALPILGDRIQLQQVILNLVVNGIDAMKDTPTENRIIIIWTSRAENFAELSVLDHGSGISVDKLKTVFEPFYTSKAEGMGMGLSIARTIVEAHYGLIWAENRDHGGASFQIRLPLVS